METLVIVPTYNEADNLRPLVEGLLGLPLPLEVCVVDDASPDGTGEVAEELGRESGRVHGIRRPGKLGLGTAYAAGMRFGLARGARVLVTMDADLSHDPAHLPALVGGMDRHDLHIGSRYIPGGEIRNWGVPRRILSRTANLVARLTLGLKAHDCTSGYRAYGRRVLERVDPASIRSEGYSWLEEMLFRVHRAGFRIGETPIVFEDRRAGHSKISKVEILRAVVTLLRLRLGG